MKVTILGSTGSIGVSTLDVISYANSVGDQAFEVDALIGGRNASLLIEQAKAFRPNTVVIQDESQFSTVKLALANLDTEVASGDAAVIEAASRPVDKVMASISGTCGLLPTMAAIDSGADVLLANKETMVCAGPIMKARAVTSGSKIIPVDSEHNAILQCLDGSQKVEQFTLTASGGPFRDASLDIIRAATPEQALAHPNWAMGAKNSLDSATMMNKGLELIEAVYLFDIPQSQIDVLVHPQSIIHSMVAYADGSVIAQMGTPDMKTPIAYALGLPGRVRTDVKRLNLAELARLDFRMPDDERFPALKLARQASDAGLIGTCVFNAANEYAGKAFLNGECGFLDISALVEYSLHRALDRQSSEMPHNVSTVDDALQVTEIVRTWVEERLKN